MTERKGESPTDETILCFFSKTFRTPFAILQLIAETPVAKLTSSRSRNVEIKHCNGSCHVKC